MATTMLRRATGGPESVLATLNQQVDLLLGNLGGRVRLVGYDGVEKDPLGGATVSTGNPTLTLSNTSGYHLLARNASDTADVLKVQDAGVTLDALTAGAITATSLVDSGALATAGPFNVGSTTNAADAGDAWVQNGLSVGTYVNPTTGQILASTRVKAPQLESTIVTGSAPLVVASTTVVTNLNANLLQGHPASDFALSGVGASYLPLAGGIMTGQFVAATGAASAPGIALSGSDLDTGIRTGGADWGILGAGGQDVLQWRYTSSQPRVGIGVAPTSPFHVSTSVTGGFVSAIGNTASSGYGLRVDTTSTSSSDVILDCFSNGVAKFYVGSDGSVWAGGVGGSMGAGTLNVGNGIYKNGTAYTNPDYALEHWATGLIVRHASSPGAADYPGLLPLSEVEAYAREHWQLPRVADRRELFSRADILLEKVEEVFLHLFEMDRRLGALERRYALDAA